MHNKLQELTDKIYQEGIVKAQHEADALLEKARAEAAAIVANANKQADSIVASANQKAEEAKRNLDAELKMASLQAMSTLKQQIADLLTLKVAEPPVGKVFGDTAYVQSLVKSLVAGYAQTGQIDMKVILPEAQRAEMDQFVKNSLAAELGKGLVVEYNKQLNAGFKVGPKDNSYVVGFSDSDFLNFFKSYLRPKTAQFLFEQQ